MPTVAADKPATVFADSVIVGGTVNPNGLPTSYHFMYDTTAALRVQTLTQSAGSGTQPVNVLATLSGLWPGTVHQWRLVAQNSSGVSWADGKVFLFRPQAPLIENCRGSSSTMGIANLVGRINPNRTTTTYHFEYDTTTQYRWRTPEQSLAAGTEWMDVQAAVTNLPGMVFRFRLVAVNDGGTAMQEAIPFKVFGNGRIREFAFPLAVGNTWIYRYTTYSGGGHGAGIHIWMVVQQTAGGCRLQVVRCDTLVSYYSGTSIVNDSLSFAVTETPDSIRISFPEWMGDPSWSTATRIPRVFLSDTDSLRIHSLAPTIVWSNYDDALYCSKIGLLRYERYTGGMMSSSGTTITLVSYSLH